MIGAISIYNATCNVDIVISNCVWLFLSDTLSKDIFQPFYLKNSIAVIIKLQKIQASLPSLLYDIVVVLLSFSYQIHLTIANLSYINNQWYLIIKILIWFILIACRVTTNHWSSYPSVFLFFFFNLLTVPSHTSI